MAIPFAPEATDRSVHILRGIFGDTIQNMVTTSDPAVVDTAAEQLGVQMEFVGNLISVFNMGLLIIAGIIASYVVIVGAANTANDGQALGKQWSSTWTPVRIVGASAVLLPTASGFSFLQLFVLACALWGVNLANQVYDAGLKHIFIAKTFVKESQASPGIEYVVVKNALKSHLCSAILSSIGDRNISMAITGGQATGWSDISPTTSFRFSIGDTKSNGTEVKNNVCGTIQYYPTFDLAPPTKSASDEDGVVYVPELMEGMTRDLRNYVIKKHLDGLKAAYSNDIGLQDIAQKMLEQGTHCDSNIEDIGLDNSAYKESCLSFTTVKNDINTALDKYHNKVFANSSVPKSVTSKQATVVSTLVNDIQGRGWSDAPGWFHKVATLSRFTPEAMRGVTLSQQSAPKDLPNLGWGNKGRVAGLIYSEGAKAIDTMVEEYYSAKTASNIPELSSPKLSLDPNQKILSIGDLIKWLDRWVKEVLDGLPEHIIRYMMPAYDNNAYKGIQYTTLDGSSSSFVVQGAREAGKSLVESFKVGFLTTFRLDERAALNQHSLASKRTEWFQVCQTQSVGLGESLLRAQCLAETALTFSDMMIATLGERLLTQSEKLEVSSTYAKKTASFFTSTGAAAGLMLGNSAPTSTNVGIGVLAGGAAISDTVLSAVTRIVGAIEKIRVVLVFVAAGLPLLPYFVFIFGVVGWVLGVLQALIAAPLWACLHMTPGQSFIGSERQGYMMLLALFIRPALLILSLLLAFWVCDPFVTYYTEAFVRAFRSLGHQSLLSDNVAIQALNVGGSFYGAFTPVTLTFIFYFIGLMGIFTLVFTLAQTLPNAVLRWLNMNVEDLGASQGADVLKNRISRGMQADAIGGGSGSAQGAAAAFQHNNQNPQPTGGSPGSTSTPAGMR